MFFYIIGLGVFVYGLFYTVASFIFDCDLQLAFYEKFGKSPRRLKGKVVFITGASSGIGEQIAISLAKHGVKLVLAARRYQELLRVKNICIATSNAQLTDEDILILPMDVTDIDSQKRHFEAAVRHFGRIDILVNNAGRSQRADWENIELPVDRQMFELNVFAVVNLSRIAIQHFTTTGSGQIAVVSSLAGVFGIPYSGTYTGTKHAIHGYFNSLRNEKADRQLTVTLLCPGPTFTNFLAESFTEKDGEKYNGSVQAKDRRMTAERCGNLCAIAIANKASEAWMAVSPIIALTYFATSFPLIFKFVVKVLGPKTVFKLRDSKDPTLKEN